MNRKKKDNDFFHYLNMQKNGVELIKNIPIFKQKLLNKEW